MLNNERLGLVENTRCSGNYERGKQFDNTRELGTNRRVQDNRKHLWDRKIIENAKEIGK